MNFSFTGVVAPTALARYQQIAQNSLVELNVALSSGSLSMLDFELVYCPIILSAEDREIYPSRSFFDPSENKYHCNPYLDFDEFISGPLGAARGAYYSGIKEAKQFLGTIGATDQQLQEFENIFNIEAD